MDVAHVLLIEDDDEVAKAWSRTLGRAGYVTRVAGSLSAARWIFDRVCTPVCPFVAVLLDLTLPDGDGADLLPELEALRPQPAVAVVSGNLDGRRAIDLWGKCTIGIPKPIGAFDLLQIVDRLVREPPLTEAWEAFCARHQLTPCERRVLRTSVAGLSAEELSKTLQLSRSTVASTWTRILRKTGCRSRAEAIARSMPPAGERQCD